MTQEFSVHRGLLKSCFQLKSQVSPCITLCDGLLIYGLFLKSNISLVLSSGWNVSLLWIGENSLRHPCVAPIIFKLSLQHVNKIEMTAEIKVEHIIR